jgi:ketosteroid isomerase-like protein
MKKKYMVLICLLAVMGFGCQNQPNGAAGSGASINQDELRELILSTAQSWNQGNLEAFIAPYDLSSTYMTPMGPIGRDTMLMYYESNYFSGDQPKQELRFDRIKVLTLGGDHALMTGQYILSGNEQPDKSGWFSLVWLRSAEGWKILHDHSN